MAQRVSNLLMRHYNAIIRTLEHDPDSIAPLLNANHYPDDPHAYLDGESWAHGVMKGIELRAGQIGSRCSTMRRGKPGCTRYTCRARKR